MKEKLKCVLLESNPNNWFTDTLFACDGIQLYSSAPNQYLPAPPNPYLLKPTDRADAVLITTNCFEWAKEKNIPIEKWCNELRNTYGKIIGIEGNASFSLGLLPEFFKEVEILIKAQGLFKDVELYNYNVGTTNPKGNWRKKETKNETQYPQKELDKLRLSVPCLIAAHPEVRKRVRKARPNIGTASRLVRNIGDKILNDSFGTKQKKQAKTTHMVGALTHIQRLDLLEILKENNISGLHGLTSVSNYIWGSEYGAGKLPEAYMNQVHERITIINATIPKMKRNKFLKSMQEHKTVLAPCGYGELSFRIAEAWQQCIAPVCQNISHVDTMYPFKENENIIYCKPDLDDIPQLMKQIEEDKINYQKIGNQGNEDWGNWITDWKLHLKNGVTNQIRKALPN